MSKVLEVLKSGMTTEIWGLRFYEQAVLRTESEEGKKVFQGLVVEERKHLDILRGEYAAVSGESKVVSVEDAMALAASVDPTEIFPQADAAEQLIPDDTSDEQALSMAMDFEARGYKLYADAATEAESLDEKAVWEWLAKAEDAHYTYLQQTHDYLVTKGSWYFDDLERPFFEG